MILIRAIMQGHLVQQRSMSKSATALQLQQWFGLLWQRGFCVPSAAAWSHGREV